MAARPAPRFVTLISLAVLCAACAADGEPPNSASSEPTAVVSLAPSLPAEPVQFAGGPLSAGVTYLLPTTPVVSITPPEGWSGSIIDRGAQLFSGRVIVRFTTGHDKVSVDTGIFEPIASDAAGIVAQVKRNAQFEVGEPVTIEIGGHPVTYVDADVLYDKNTEGGAPILATDQTALHISDSLFGRLYIMETSQGIVFVMASGFEATQTGSLVRADLIAVIEPLIDSLELAAP